MMSELNDMLSVKVVRVLGVGRGRLCLAIADRAVEITRLSGVQSGGPLWLWYGVGRKRSKVGF